jgi:hypothetical protein
MRLMFGTPHPKLGEKWWAGNVARMGERRGIHRVLLGKPEGKRENTWKTQS